MTAERDICKRTEVPFRNLLHFHINTVQLERCCCVRFREVPVSNLGTEMGYPDEVFLVFSQSLQANIGILS
jgi:hypothetical protein